MLLGWSTDDNHMPPPLSAAAVIAARAPRPVRRPALTIVLDIVALLGAVALVRLGAAVVFFLIGMALR